MGQVYRARDSRLRRDVGIKIPAAGVRRRRRAPRAVQARSAGPGVAQPHIAPITGSWKVREAGPPPRLVILGCKPQQLDDVVTRLSAHLTAQTVVVSILVGVEVATLREKFWTAGAVVRALPNLPVSVRRGVVALYGDDLPGEVHDELSQLFALLGFAMWTNTEANLVAIGSVAGAGPAYVAKFIDALTKAGVDRGLSSETARCMTSCRSCSHC